MAAKITAAPLTKSGQFFYLLDIGTGFKNIFPKTIHYRFLNLIMSNRRYSVADY